MKLTQDVIWWLCFFLLQECILAPKIKLNDGREIPEIGFGTWLGNDTNGRVQSNGSEIEEAVKMAIDAGYRYIDTAYIYMIEDQVGRAIAAKIAEGVVTRDDLFVTTKLWNSFHARDQVIGALQTSLNSLQLEYVDLYLIHWPVGQFDNGTYDLTDYADTWRGLAEARERGLTRSIGLSNFNTSQVERLMTEGLPPPAVLQVELHVNLQQPELRAWCAARGIAVAGHSPFGLMMPVRRPPDAPPPDLRDPWLLDMAAKYGKSVPQIVLRYLTQLGVIPIPKSLHKARIEENFNIFDFSLNEEEQQALQSYDINKRLLLLPKWKDYPYYPFE